MRNRLVFLLLIMLTGLAVLAVRAIEEIALVQPSTLGIALVVQIVLQAELLAIIPFEPEGLAGHLDPVLHAVRHRVLADAGAAISIRSTALTTALLLLPSIQNRLLLRLALTVRIIVAARCNRRIIELPVEPPEQRLVGLRPRHALVPDAVVQLHHELVVDILRLAERHPNRLRGIDHELVDPRQEVKTMTEVDVHLLIRRVQRRQDVPR